MNHSDNETDITRWDSGLGFLLKYENVAWFDEEKKELRILDRRIYPVKTVFAVCKKYEETVQAIKDMVTQSGGPFAAASMGMALAAQQFKNLTAEQYGLKMEEAAYNLANARPTTASAMEAFTGGQLSLFKEMINQGESSASIVKALKRNAVEQNNRRYEINIKAGGAFAEKVKNGSAVLTHCFGETTTGGFLKAFKTRKKNVKIFCSETRPFLQGARLTASLAASMGFDTTVITDNMPAALMQAEKIDCFVSASDVITMDGHIVNKTGTLQTAIACKYFGVPYFAIGLPDKSHPDKTYVKIEMRNGEESLKFLNIKTAAENVKGLYPSFDITPPGLCRGIATDKGIYHPEKIALYFSA